MVKLLPPDVRRPKCTKFSFLCGCAPDLDKEAYSAPQTDPLAVFEGLLLRGEWKGRRGEGEMILCNNIQQQYNTTIQCSNPGVWSLYAASYV